jgi:hypothetical protein
LIVFALCHELGQLNILAQNNIHLAQNNIHRNTNSKQPSCKAPHLLRQFVIAALCHELSQLLLGDEVRHVVAALAIVLIHSNHLYQLNQQVVSDDYSTGQGAQRMTMQRLCFPSCSQLEGTC